MTGGSFRASLEGPYYARTDAITAVLDGCD